jgi:Fe-S cluster biogenesis protein NfuA
MRDEAGRAISTHDMRISLCRLLVAGGSIMVGALCSGCAGNEGTLQSRIENKINNPETTSNVTPTTEHYNSFAQDFEPEWPFGPYSRQ